jgi:hypothetical protein
MSAEPEGDAGRKLKYLQCPHCQERIAVLMSARLEVPQQTYVFTSSEAHQAQWRKELPEMQRLVLDLAERNGMLSAFRKAAETAHRDSVPSHIEPLFLRWIRECRQVMIPQEHLRRLSVALNDPHHITCFATQGILGVASGRALRLFVPAVIVLGLKKKTRDGLRLAVEPDEAKLDEWIRTRWGYVTEPIVLDELRKRSFGAFARPLLGS